jgi:hypothetical protein
LALIVVRTIVLALVGVLASSLQFICIHEIVGRVLDGRVIVRWNYVFFREVFYVLIAAAIQVNEVL